MDLDAITQQVLPNQIMMYSVKGPITNHVADLLDFVMTPIDNPYSLHLVNLGKATTINEYGIEKILLIQQLLESRGHRWVLTLDGAHHVLFEGLARGLKNKNVFIFKTRDEAIRSLLEHAPTAP